MRVSKATEPEVRETTNNGFGIFSISNVLSVNDGAATAETLVVDQTLSEWVGVVAPLCSTTSVLAQYKPATTHSVWCCWSGWWSNRLSWPKFIAVAALGLPP